MSSEYIVDACFVRIQIEELKKEPLKTYSMISLIENIY